MFRKVSLKEKSYRLDLRILHPTRPAPQIIEQFPFPTHKSNSAGEQRNRQYPLTKGTHTRVSFKLHERPLEFDEVDFEEFLLQQLSKINFDYTSRLLEEGAKCKLVVGVFSNESAMFELDTETISQLMEASFGISVYFYGGD